MSLIISVDKAIIWEISFHLWNCVGKLLSVTPEELAKHNTEADCWIAFRGLVYNITPYMEFHPGGADELMRAAGTDGTQLFDEVSSNGTD